MHKIHWLQRKQEAEDQGLEFTERPGGGPAQRRLRHHDYTTHSTTLTMKIILFPDADAAYIQVQPGAIQRTHEVDDATFVDLDPEGKPLNIQFLCVGDGVDQRQIAGLTDQENRQVFSLLQGSGINVTPLA